MKINSSYEFKSGVLYSENVFFFIMSPEVPARVRDIKQIVRIYSLVESLITNSMIKIISLQSKHTYAYICIPITISIDCLSSTIVTRVSDYVKG